MEKLASIESEVNTPLQRGAKRCCAHVNRFNGLSHLVETVETVEDASPPPSTPLKRGVNQSERHCPAQFG